MNLVLYPLKPFAQGGNRLCFVHPTEPGRCIKVRRPDFSLRDCRRKKGFPKNLRPLSAFDDNLEEYRVVQHLSRVIGPVVHRHIYRCFGFVETDLGAGLEAELIRDADGMISLSLKQFLWEFGYTEQCRQAVEQLTDFWREYKIPSRDLLTHNIVVQQGGGGEILRLVVIDGLGAPTLIPFHWLPQRAQEKKVVKRIGRLHARIAEFLQNCANGKQASQVGMLLHRDHSGGRKNTASPAAKNLDSES